MSWLLITEHGAAVYKDEDIKYMLRQTSGRRKLYRIIDNKHELKEFFICRGYVANRYDVMEFVYEREEV